MHSLKLKHIQLTIHICPFKNPIPSGQTALKQQRTCCYIRQRVKRGSKVQGRGERTRVCVCVCVCVSPQLCLHSETEVRCHKDGSSPLETAEVCQWETKKISSPLFLPQEWITSQSCLETLPVCRLALHTTNQRLHTPTHSGNTFLQSICVLRRPDVMSTTLKV